MNPGSPPLEKDPRRLLLDGAAALGVSLSPEALAHFRIYLQELQTWNARVNLTGLKSDRDIIIKGFLDSLAVLPFLLDAPSLADLGSGAGFPGLVLKLARPDLILTMVESRGKKAAFSGVPGGPSGLVRGGGGPGPPDPPAGQGVGSPGSPR
jgi:16S rRNA (guanine527-N7)-methyltransferase